MKNEVHCLISAGPTREWLDPVRFISNPSSGKMGYALANAAKARGFKVTLVSGPVTLPCPTGVDRIMVNTAVEINEVMGHHFPLSSLTIMTAAVCDQRSAIVHQQKIKKDMLSDTIELVPNPDILLNLGKQKRMDQILVGFAAETDNLENHAINKLNEKNCDWIVANDVSNKKIGFNSDFNEVSIFYKNNKIEKLKYKPKSEISDEIVDKIINHLN